MEDSKISVEVVRVNAPYPDLSDIKPNLRSAKIISKAYAGQHGELAAILQYTFHDINASYQNYDEVASLLKGISISEMQHLEMLGEALIRLGVTPIFSNTPPLRNNFFSTKNLSYSTQVVQMLKDDIIGEKNAIKDYQDMLDVLDDQQVAALIQRIKIDEELHVARLEEMLQHVLETSAAKFKK